MQLNCDVDINIIPANNYTAFENVNITIDSPGPITTICPQTITISQNTTLTCQQMAIAYEIPTAGIRNLNNDLDCNWVNDQDVCAPMSCPIAVVSTSSSSINVDEYIRNQDNFTMTQFLTWNPYIGSRQIANGDAICVGPPGGLYIPPSATVSTNSTYTSIAVATVNGTTPTTSNTTATFVGAPTTTVTGTTSECYEWHIVVSGDTCQLIEAEYGITLEEFIALNTYVNSTCGNIWPDYAYCVSGIATANNSTSTAAITATSTSPPISVTTSGTLTTATASGSITTPTPTQTGMVSGCTTFYKAVSGDGCYAIATSYDITLDEFYEWNAAVGNDCSGLWPDYYYCVGI
ncbi:hypothetical protein N7468_008891 [Penicillium chermesinum]|uniref:LysM domain-containing protein n=1 Tax=Penicillium chermesinum TaxID=63820 RepID=A0A9W9NGR6_9EURO|nr:uncharacterized protein N7468_008891 [Penicillium chermesinum]KAJ5219687.1 hypothetical protein N7468_008891 [Penicillium chermesinum]